MHYVYLIRSINQPQQIYIGHTKNLKARLANHNSGSTFHTAKNMPWELIVFFGFKDEMSAYNFEIYLKSGTGRAFIKKRLLL